VKPGTERGHGLMAIVERATERFLGRSGLKYWPQFDETEVGWVLRADVWGHGFATEAGGPCLDWGFRALDDPYLTAMIVPDNVRSIQVATRLGMRPLRRDLLMDLSVVVFSIDRPGSSEHHLA
jgi:RimJ/RimL family protein N-acetyltransferase